MQINPVVQNSDVDPAMAWRQSDLLLLALATNNVLRDPRRYKMGSKFGQLFNLLHQMFELVKSAAIGSRKVMKCRTVRARADITRFQAPLSTFFGGGPWIP